MRKYLAIVISIIFVLGITALTYAAEEPQIKLGGKILVRGWSFKNVSGLSGAPGPKKSATASFYTTNANIMLDAKVADNVQGYMELESSGGGNTQSGLYVWGGGEDAKPSAPLYFRQLWLQYSGSGIGVPVTLKAGHMPISLGEKQFLNNERFGDDLIMLLINPNKELTIGLVTVKVVEGADRTSTNDVDVYGGLATYAITKDMTAGANLTLVNQNVSDMQLWNLGLHGNGKVDGLSFAGEIDLQAGNIGTGANEMKYKGYGIMVKAGYKVDPINIRASAAMGSGDDNSTDKNIKQFVTFQGPDTVSPVARFVHYTQIYERTVMTAAGTRNAGISNTTYANLGADVAPMADLSLSLDGYWLRATKALVANQKKDLGYEIDLKAAYKLAKNLTYFVEGGYFAAGKFYEKVGGGNEGVMQVIHGLNLTF